MTNAIIYQQALASPTASVEESSRDLQHSSGLQLFNEEELALEDEAVEGLAAMEFEGPITPGGPDVRLEGTAQQIYHQIMSLNPEYDVWNFPENVAEFEAQGLTKADLQIGQDEIVDTSPNPTFDSPSVLRFKQAYGKVKMILPSKRTAWLMLENKPSSTAKKAEVSIPDIVMKESSISKILDGRGVTIQGADVHG